jgi:capsular polysaccharide biosynthesis protein
MICTWIVTIASSIAFLATCYPVGAASTNVIAALAVGVAAAIGCAVCLTILFLRIGRRRAAKKRMDWYV